MSREFCLLWSVMGCMGSEMKPIGMKHVYLDNAATTPVDPRVLAVMDKFYTDRFEMFGNPASPHWAGREVRRRVEYARVGLGGLLGLSEDMINTAPTVSTDLTTNLNVSEDRYKLIFTSCGSEGNTLLILGLARRYLREHTDHERSKIIFSRIEHSSIISLERPLRELGYHVEYVGVDRYGRVDLVELEDLLDEHTLLVSIMHVNNELGTIQDIQKISKLCRDHNVLFHCDTVQSFGKLQISLGKHGPDMITVSAHKFYGPKGVGFVCVRDDIHLEPIIFGGSEEYGIRSGTLNVPGIIGMWEAARLIYEERDEVERHISRLTEKLINGLLSLGARLNSPESPRYRVPGLVNVRFPGVDGRSLLLHLNKQGIACSQGSACSSGSPRPSHVLRAIGLSDKDIQSSIRFSVGRFNNEEDVDYTISVLEDLLKHL